MLNYQNCNIQKVSAHIIGNKSNGEKLHHSKSLLDISDERISALLLKYFIAPFNTPEFYSFDISNRNSEDHSLFNIATEIFANPKAFRRQSGLIAKHLYELSEQPEIKPGELFVAYISNIILENEVTEAIGIFKVENKHSYLKLDALTDDFSINYDEGINIERPDLGCLIFNHEKKSGYKICIIDKSAKSSGTQYWKDNFLNVKPCADDYHNTKDFMFITKNFVTEQLPEDFEFSRADQIDLLNRSADYFKTHDTFQKQNFEREVFQDEGVIKSFRKYDESYREQHDIDVSDDFEISPFAVKKQSKVFKSILKLDKNFHIYIHGNRELIEQGTEQDGRKFYKIYFKEEH